jgi:Ca2+-binding EF-hand superfamily protein
MSGLQPMSRQGHVVTTSPGAGPAEPAAPAARAADPDRVQLGTVKPLLARANAVFAKVDTDHDGTLSRKELAAASTATGFAKNDLAAIKTMGRFVGEIASLSDDEHFTESKGITRDDLDQLGKLAADKPLADQVTGSFANGGLAPVARPAAPAQPPVKTATTTASKAGTALGAAASPASPVTAAKTTTVAKTGTPAKPKASLLQRLRLSSFTNTVTTFWEDKTPWAHQRANVRQVDANAKAVETPFTKDARAVFGAVDADRNGTLSSRELNRAVASPEFKKGQAAAVGTLQKYADDIEDLSHDERFLETKGITRNDLNQFDKLKDDSKLRGEVRGNYSWGRSKITATDRRLFAHGDASIRGTAIEQGSLGDCYFLAGVASLASTKPEAIKQMIATNKDGTFTVSFPGRKPVTVTAPTDAEIARYASTGRQGIWLNVLEKAYAKSRNDSRLFAKGDMYKAIEGGFGRQSIRALTGSTSETSLVALLSPSQLLAKVSQGQADGRLMTIATGHPVGRHRTKANDLPTGHEYTVMGYDAATRKFLIRNPWGSGGAKDDGMLALSAEEVKKNFVKLTVEKAKGK